MVEIDVTEAEEEGMKEYVLTEQENNCLSEFLKDMSSELSYLPSYHRDYQNSPWVFCSPPTLSLDSVRSSTPVPNLVDLIIKEKIKSALHNLKFGHDDDVESGLFQFWAPVTIEGRCFLTTLDQPFALNKIRHASIIQSYRKHSMDCKFRVDDDNGASEQNLGLPGRVFRTKVPECTPNVRYYSNKEYPQRYHAVNCKLRKSVALPVFKSNGQVVGVLESILLLYSLDYLFNFVHAVCKAFKEVGLICLSNCSHFDEFLKKRCDFRDTIHEIKEVFKVVCKTHRIPLAQTWVSCKHCSDVAYGDSYVYPDEEILIPLGVGGSYALDNNMHDFRYFGNYLRKGQGVPGKAYLSHNSCFCSDVTQLNMFRYPMAHIARHLGLAGSFAICLRNFKTGDQDYVLEFFMPPSESNCEDPTRTLLDPIMVTMKHHFRSFKLSSGKELGDELSVEVLELDMCEKLVSFKLCQSTISPPRSEPLQSGRDIIEADLPYQESMVEIEAINEGRNDNASAERIDEIESEEEGIEEDVSIESSEEGMEENVLIEEENDCLSKFLKDMSSELSYLPPVYQNSPWVFCGPPTLSLDSVRSSTPVSNLVDLIIKEKIKSALHNVKIIDHDDEEVLFQFWAPITIEGRCFLTTSDQPFALNKILFLSSLRSYRKHSMDYKFRVDDDGDDGASEQNLGLPGRVFRTKVPEYSPNVRFYSNKEYPQRYHAVNCKVTKSVALPVFKSNGQVVGVLESILASYNLDELYNLFKAVRDAFKKVGLTCLCNCSHFDEFLQKECDFRDTIDEIKKVFEAVCKTYRLPFAQTWLPCKHCSDVAYGDSYVYPNEEILISLGVGSYALDKNIRDFRFVENYLRKGQGVPGKAYLSHNSCFCRDVTQLNMFQYPLAHFARYYGFASSFAICLRSSKTGDQDYVLEFFLPPSVSNCEDPTRTLLEKIMVTMKQHFWSFKLSSGKELGDELSVEVLELEMCEKLGSFKLCQSTISPPRSEPLQSGRDMEADLPYQESMVKSEAINEGRNDNASPEPIDEAFISFKKKVTVENTTSEKERRNDEIPITYEVICQYMGRTSLEDAAKSLGVSRSTLKRRRRSLGIMRWKSPKGKRKKQSLQKTTRHMNESIQDSPQTMVQDSLASSSLHPVGDSASWHQTNSFLAFQHDSALSFHINSFLAFQQGGENRVPNDLHPLAVEAPLEEQDHLVEKLVKPQQLPTNEIKIPKLTQQEKKIVDYIFDSRESIGETLVNYQLEHGTRNDMMHSLRAGKWLHDIIINLMVCKLTFEERGRHSDMNYRAWYFPTYFAQQILGEGAQVSGMLNNFFGPERYSGLLPACEKVFIPVNEKSEHWFLCVIDMQQGAVNILDPLPIPSKNKDREEMVGKIVNFMDKLLAHLHGDEYKRRIVDFPIQRPRVPQQNNLHDCGVYVIKFMECYDDLPKVQFRFDSVHAREKIAVDLVLEKHNEVGDVVLNKVQRHKPRNESM